MLSTAILLATGILGLYWAFKAQNLFTKFTSGTLCLSVLLLIIPYGPVRAYSPYVLALTSLFAGFEPGSSMRIKTYHKVFFGAFGVIFAAMAVDRVITWPFFDLQFWPMALLYLAILAYFLNSDFKMIRTRLGTVFAWAGMALDYLIRLLF